MTAQANGVEQSLLQHFAGLKGIRGASALIRDRGQWAEAARFGEVQSDRFEAVAAAYDPAGGGEVSPLPAGGWQASYMAQGAGLDLIAVLNFGALPPAELQAVLEQVELRVGWLLVAAMRDHQAGDDDRILAAEIGAGLLLGAARARSRGALADLWIARIEPVFQPVLTAVCWAGATVPKLALVSGGGPVDGHSEQRHLIEDIARRAYDNRVPVRMTATAPAAGDQGVTEPALAQLDAATAWALPVDDGQHIAAVVVLCLPADGTGHDSAVLADQISALLAESLLIQRRSYPGLWQKTRNWISSIGIALFGKTAWKLKLALLFLLVLAAIAALIPATERPAFTARIEAEDRQIISAPYDGFLADAPFRSGDRVAAGDVLVRLDDADLRLQLAQRRSEQAEIESQLQTARAQRDSATIRQLETRIEQGAIALSLLDRQIAQAQFAADRPLLVIGGDAWRRVGDRVRLGEPLVEVASPDRFHLRAFVDEDWIAAMADGTAGTAVLTAFPTRPIAVRLVSIGRDAAMVDGRYTFPVVLEFDTPPDLALLDGMRGVVRLDLAQGSLLWVYTRGVRRWVDRLIWRWA